MKKRQRKILEYIFHNGSTSINELLEVFQISRRTLYYDIAAINEKIVGYGEIKNANKELQFFGQHESISMLAEVSKSSICKEDRIRMLMYSILNEEFDKIESAMDELKVSKNTIFNDIVDIRRELAKYDLKLEYRSGYRIVGKEKNIRELYMKLMILDNHLIHCLDKKVLLLNQQGNLELTDYSIAALSQFIRFIEKRVRQNHFIEAIEGSEEAESFSHHALVQRIFSLYDKTEIDYLTLYVATLSSLKQNISEDKIKKYVDNLVDTFENLSAAQLNEKEQFKQHIQRHIQSSYYRIKYKFPCFNPGLEEIKNNYSYLFRLVKQAVEQSGIAEFQNIREEEIGFLAMYFGGNLRTSTKRARNRVLIICPNGLMVSKMLEDQLRNYIPIIDIVGVISIRDLQDYSGLQYDYIVSTIAIPEAKNVITVRPILTKRDINTLVEKIVDIAGVKQENLLEKIKKIIRENCVIKEEERLNSQLMNLFSAKENKREEQPMLKELLTRDKMKKVKKCSTWQEAIAVAAQPLLEEGAITGEYIDLMIENVNTHGPYIVLEEGFALPHAAAKEGVNHLAMSLLYLEEAVDLMGHPIHVMVVLATVDNISHLRALSALSELLSEEEKLQILMKGDLEEIHRLIQEEE